MEEPKNASTEGQSASGIPLQEQGPTTGLPAAGGAEPQLLVAPPEQLPTFSFQPFFKNGVLASFGFFLGVAVIYHVVASTMLGLYIGIRSPDKHCACEELYWVCLFLLIYSVIQIFAAIGEGTYLCRSTKLSASQIPKKKLKIIIIVFLIMETLSLSVNGFLMYVNQYKETKGDCLGISGQNYSTGEESKRDKNYGMYSLLLGLHIFTLVILYLIGGYFFVAKEPPETPMPPPPPHPTAALLGTHIIGD